MESLSKFLSMGGYGGYVWPAYTVTAVVMLALLVASLRAFSRSEADLKSLEAEAKEIRSRRRTALRREAEAGEPE